MPKANGEQLATTLIRALPSDLAEQLLSRMGTTAERVRANLVAGVTPTPATDLDAALTEFFDLHRIVGRGYIPSVPAGEYRPVAKAAEDVGEPQPPPDPIESLKKLPPDKLVRALEGEPPSAVALVLSVLDAEAAGRVLKSLPADVRADTAIRYSQPGSRNFALVNQIAQAVTDKGNSLDDQPAAAAVETDRIADLAAMLRGLPRQERLGVLQKIETSDSELADKLRGKLFRFTDLGKIDDRPLQQILTQLNLRSIASALKGADPEISEKILKNISSRSRELLGEEMEMLGNLAAAKVQEAQAEILTILRQYEEQGKVSLED